jgi:DNA repair exonuclease SbcCD ATPase subunit
LKEKRDELEESISDTKSALRLFDQKHIIEKRLETLSDCDPDAAQEELNTVRDTLRRLTNKELPKAEQKAELVDDLRKLHKPSRDEDNISNELNEATLKAKDLERQISSAKEALENDICPTCGRPFEDEVDYDADDLKDKKQKLQKKLSAVQKEVHELRTEQNNALEYNKLKKQLDDLGAVASAADVQKEITRLTREEKRLVSALESRQLRKTLEKQLNDLPSESKSTLENRLKKDQKKLNKFKQQYDDAQRIFSRLEKIAGLPKGKPARLRGRIIAAKKTVRDAMVALARLGEEKAELQKQYDHVLALTKRKIKIEKGLEKTKQTKTEIACLRALEQVFGSKGLKRDRFMAILRDAAEQTVPYYTNLLWPKRNTEIKLVEVNNTVKFELLRDGVVTGSRLLSGGERNKAGLALLFGLRDLKEKYTGLKSNVLIVDEPFGNMDPFSTDNLIRVLDNQKQRFSSVFVIGNQRDVLEHEGWDQVWWAVKENGVSALYTDGLPGRYEEEVARYQKKFG